MGNLYTQLSLEERTMIHTHLAKMDDARAESALSGFTQEELDGIAWTLNTRPRMSLGFRCPAELFTPDAFNFRPHHAALFALGH